jgi:flap endonuclease-1
MGVAITELLEGKEIEIKSLSGKRVAIDAFNTIYQFLTVLRGPDGNPLCNSKGQVTSHLKGLLSRNAQFLKEGIKPIFVFDGKAPLLKKEEKERRREVFDENQRKYDVAKERNDFEEMRKYSQRLIRITPEIIDSSKKLLDLMGIPWVQAESEGEAQGAHMVKTGSADVLASQDADGLLFGSPNLLRNLSITGKKKVKGKLGYEIINPIMYSLSDTMNKLGLTKEQLIVLAILVGTDYDIGGIKNLGPKKSLKMVKMYGNDFDRLFADVKWSEQFEVDWKEIKNFFENPPVKDVNGVVWKNIDTENLLDWLKNEYEFSDEGLKQTLGNIDAISDKQKQKGLSDFW